MSTRYRITAVKAREDNGTKTFHLAKGSGSSDWQEIWCGGGVVYPGWQVHVLPDEVCPDCARASHRAATT